MALDLKFSAKVEDAEIYGINEYLGISKMRLRDRLAL